MPRQKVRQTRRAIPAGARTRVKTSRMPTTWLASETETASTSMKATESPGLQARKKESAGKQGERAEAQQRKHGHLDDLAGRNAEDLSEKYGGRLSGESAREAEKQGADAERHGENHADGHVAALEFIAGNAHENARPGREKENALQRIEPEQRRRRRAGEADVRKRVRGKSDISYHDKIADDGAEDGRERAGEERLANEVVAEVGGERINHDGRTP